MTGYEDLLALMRSRRSIRRFSRREVRREELSRLFEAARWAPSNHNRQPWRFLVVDDPVQIGCLAERIRAGVDARLKSLPGVAASYAGELSAHATVFSSAPVVIVALHKRPVSLAAALLEGVPNPVLVSGEPLSVAMAVQNLLLAAEALQLGTCVMTAPLLSCDVVAGMLSLPPGYDVTCFVAVGYPDEEPETPRRKGLEQIVTFIEPGH